MKKKNCKLLTRHVDEKYKNGKILNIRNVLIML